MKITTNSQTETRYYSNVPLDEKTASEIFEVFDHFDVLFDNPQNTSVKIINKPQKIVINEVRGEKPFSQAFKSFLEYVLLFILSIFGFITLGSIHGLIAFLMLLLGIFLAFCVFVKSVDLFEATANFISNH